MLSPQGEHVKAQKLTERMLDSLAALVTTSPAPYFVRPVPVQMALRRRGFIVPVLPHAPLEAKTLYHITAAGRTALRIAGKGNNGA